MRGPIQPGDLVGKITDVHAHIGVSIGAYARLEFPYCQSVEGLYYRHRANNVDYGVVFPLAPDLYFDLPTSVNEGRMVPAADPLSSAPYSRENRLLLTEVYDYCPEYGDRFIPFVCVDPVREVDAQLRALFQLEQEFPIYGIKVSPVACQSRLTGLLAEGAPLLAFAAERDLPLLCHVTVHPDEQFSQVQDALGIADRHPHLRFCLAHCLGFSQRFFERARDAPNVWVDTAALKIQVQLACQNSPIVAPLGERLDLDYRDHRQVMCALAELFPHTLVWGSDSPAYSYICRRLQAPGRYARFSLKANYEDEKAALDALASQTRERVSSANVIRFLFGKAKDRS